jgi:hypothetical protein
MGPWGLRICGARAQHELVRLQPYEAITASSRRPQRQLNCRSAACATGSDCVPLRNRMKEIMSPVPGGITKIEPGTTRSNHWSAWLPVQQEIAMSLYFRSRKVSTSAAARLSAS